MKAGFVHFQLPCGGYLHVQKRSWCIQYLIPGPTGRHKEDVVEFPGSEINDLIKAYKENFNEYERFSAAAPKGAVSHKIGLLNMTIVQAPWAKGICIRLFHNPISTRDELKSVLQGLYAAAGNVFRIQAFITEMEDAAGKGS